MPRKPPAVRVVFRDDPESGEAITPSHAWRKDALICHGVAIHGSFVQLCAWWAIWSVYDAYLLTYTPVSEILILLCCVPLYLLPTCIPMVRNHTRTVHHSIEQSLGRI